MFYYDDTMVSMSCVLNTEVDRNEVQTLQGISNKRP